MSEEVSHEVEVVNLRLIIQWQESGWAHVEIPEMGMLLKVASSGFLSRSRVIASALSEALELAEDAADDCRDVFARSRPPTLIDESGSPGIPAVLRAGREL